MPGLDEQENEFRWRLKEPDLFDRFRRKEIDTGVAIVLGHNKNTGDWEAQALRFAKPKFDAEKARKWIKDHKGSFEEWEDKEKKYTELYDIRGVEIFSSGTWNGDKYTEKDLDNMVQAFEATKSAMKPYLKLGHDDKQKLLQADGLPALGWIEKVYKSGKKLIADFTKIPKKIYELIKNGAYRRVSSEIFFNMKIGDKRYPRMLKAVALLGGDTPAVQNLNDIIALYNLEGVRVYEEDNTNVKTYEFDKKTKGEDMELEELKKEHEALQKKYEEAEAAKVAAEEKAKGSEAKANEAEKKVEEATKVVEEAKAKVEEAEKQKEEAAKEKEKLEEEVKKNKMDVIKNDINTVIDKLIEGKKILPVQKEAFFTLLFELRTAPGEVKKYKIGEEEKSLENIVLDIVEKHEYSINTDGSTDTGDTGAKKDNTELMMKANKYAEEHKVSYKEALKEVSK